MDAVRTTCPYCGVGCGVIAKPDGKGGATVEGDPDHPANFGRLCSKGAALGETLELDRRLLHPTINGARASWDTAIQAVADAFSAAIAEHGPDSLAIYGSGQLLTEDYYVANKLMKGFIGTGNMDTNSRLCMASSVAGHKSVFGEDIVPGLYEDLETADTVVLVGSNLAWCHPVLFQRLQAAKQARPGMVVVNIDPRRTATSDIADLQLSIKPGSDVALFTGLLAAIDQNGAADRSYLARFVENAEPAFAAARNIDVLTVSQATGLSPERVMSFYDLWLRRERVVTIYSQGVNQSTEGVAKVQAILNCHLASGRIGREGMGPFSVTGQPNAMGGREVGGLANMLAAHLDLENAQHRAAVQNFWGAPRIADRPGLKAVDLFKACADGRIKALWVMATNPVVSMPDAGAVQRAMQSVPFVAVSDISQDSETARLAHVLLPALGWGEKDGTVTNSERRISRQRAFLAAPGEARADWQIVSDVARAMGFGDAFNYTTPADIFREHVALSAVAADAGRGFDIAALADVTYDSMAPTLWPTGGKSERFFAKGGFSTPNRKARMQPTPPKPAARTPGSFRLNTGRIRDQWHTMTRTGISPRLGRHIAEPFLEIAPIDAMHLGLTDADLARVWNAGGAAVLRVLVTDRTPRGVVFAPMHWSAANSVGGAIGALAPPDVDPVSGQPDLKGGTVWIERFQPAWQAFAITQRRPTPETAYWATARLETGWRTELAGENHVEDWSTFAAALFGAGADADWVTAVDLARSSARIAATEDGQVAGLLIASRGPVEAARAYLTQAFDEGAPAELLLAGRPANDRPDPGATVCSCFSVGANQILASIAGGAASVQQIGVMTEAGTNCGSCRPELAIMLQTHARAAAE